MKNRISLIVLSMIFSLTTLSLPAEERETQLQNLWTFHWELDEMPEGQESATPVAPVEVTFLDKPVEIASHSASLALMQKYSVYLGAEWSPGHAYRLYQTFESVPQNINYSRWLADPSLEPSLWQLSDRHIQNDITVQYREGQRIVTVAAAAFVHATPLFAEIDGVRGRYFSKRLHRAVVRFVSGDGTDKYALQRILQERYAVSINVPDYTELTQHTTGEHAGRFSEFKNEELIALISMLEEFPSGMLKTPGLKYLVRRLDGTPHPINPAAAVAWTSAGYIEFMESAFKGQSVDAVHRLILHEKAHFLWDHLFDEQLKADWIELGGWFENPDDPDGWSTTKQVEFVSAYAHGVNPNEDMAESISFYIVRPDRLRSRSPAKYEFIQNRIMHGTRYISKIREDLTFQVYNLYPDYVYPGRIIRVDIQVKGEPEEDKLITVEIQLHKESELDAAQSAYIVVFSEKGTYFDMWLSAVDANGMSVASGHILRGQATVSRYAANGYWHTDQIMVLDAQRNARYSDRKDFGWKLYIENPIADDEAPIYVKDSLRLSLSEAETGAGRAYQILAARWRFVDKDIKGVYAVISDASTETYSRQSQGKYDPETQSATAILRIPDYAPSGTYKVNHIFMVDVALNQSMVYFTDSENDEPPVTIEVQTTNPDSLPPVLDVNRITVEASPTHPEAPNGETQVDITFRVKDNISGYAHASIYLRDPQGNAFFFGHSDKEWDRLYFSRDPTVYETYHKTIILPVGSAPGVWGLAEMSVIDKVTNQQRYDFTEIVRFEVGEVAAAPTIASLPKDTQLLANYPNPFNPETWIPYQLAEAAGVTVTIYNLHGLVVRNLDFGHQAAGIYQDKNRAAYWDGKNALGETVASGVYFYTLTAGDFTATRKLLIRK